MSLLIISFITHDKPGIVEQLSNIVKKHQGNWKKSSLHQLSGMFSGIIEITCPDKSIVSLSQELTSLPDFKIHVEHVTTTNTNLGELFTLELTANDRTGIIKEISTVINQHGGNLLKLVSSQVSAPHAGNDIFKAKATITCENNRIDNLVEKLENLADDLMVDISR